MIETKINEWEINLKKYNLTIIIILLLLFVLFVPYFVRFYQGNTAVLGSESYLTMRYAEELIDYKELTMEELAEKYSFTPDIVYTRRTYHFNPYHVVLAFLGYFFGLQNIAHILPIILGLISVILFAKIIESSGFERYRRNLALLFLVTSPAFIYAFTFSTSHSLAIMLSLLSIFLFMQKRLPWFVLSMICMFIVSLFSVFNLVLLFLILLVITLKNDKKRSRFFIALFFSILFIFIARSNLYYSYTTPGSGQFFSLLFSDLGGFIGFGFISALLVFLGLGTLWKKRKQMVSFIIPLIILLSYVYVGEGFFMYLAFFIAIAAAEGFIRMAESEWSLPMLKLLTVIILICGVIFSTVSYTSRLIEAEPSPETLHSLELLSKASKAGDIILTHPKYGYWIESVADRKVFADTLSTDNYNQQFVYKIEDAIFKSRDLDETETLLRNYNIRYIWITPEMKEGLVWTKKDEGLLFLLENSESFKKVYSTYGYDIWEVI
ncbi:MAG: glucosyltransferase domain-containing protein [Nanoarchaeota archaeon]|nr:glucosyltransferase domain-containing protein [Nanoarchaeota archaeon]